VVPVTEIRAKERNLSIPLYVDGETWAQTDAATETATTEFQRRWQVLVQSAELVSKQMSTPMSDK